MSIKRVSKKVHFLGQDRRKWCKFCAYWSRGAFTSGYCTKKGVNAFQFNWCEGWRDMDG